MNDDFERAWQAYPRRVGKGEARKAWAQMVARTGMTSADLLSRVLDALAWQRQQPQWLKDGGQFIPHMATWLRAERWDDEPFVAPTLTDKNAQNMATLARLLGGRTAS